MPTLVGAYVERSFSVHGRDDAPSRGRCVEALNFHDAVLVYLEAFSPEDEGAEVAVMVEDCETGERQCFRIDLATGDTAPCD